MPHPSGYNGISSPHVVITPLDSCLTSYFIQVYESHVPTAGLKGLQRLMQRAVEVDIKSEYISDLYAPRTLLGRRIQAVASCDWSDSPQP